MTAFKRQIVVRGRGVWYFPGNGRRCYWGEMSRETVLEIAARMRVAVVTFTVTSLPDARVRTTEFDASELPHYARGFARY